MLDDLSKMFVGIALNDISKSSISFKQIELYSSDYFITYSFSLFSYSTFSYSILRFYSMLITVSSFNSSGYDVDYLFYTISKGYMESNYS